jgi:voltage-gated potassium channel
VAPKREVLIPRPILVAFGVLVAVLVLGTIGYHSVEGFGWFDSVYMSLTTVTTLGDSPIRPASRVGRLITLFVVCIGFGVLSYGLVSLVPFVVEGQFGSAVNSRSMRRKVMKMKNHYVLCGFGRVGAEVARHLAEESVEFVVIDTDDACLREAADHGYAVINGNAAQASVLERAGIGVARCLIAAVNTDADNLYVTVAARVLRPDLLIVARANTTEAEQRLKFAGADHILSPYRTAGRLMAQMAVHPQVAELQDDLAIASALAKERM